MSEGSGTDFVVVAYRDDGVWRVAPLPSRAADDLSSLVAALRQLAIESDALGFVSVDDEFFVAARVRGDKARLLLSDVGAATEWLLAREVLDALELPEPDEDDLEEVRPAGDMALFADLGLSADDVSFLCRDAELYPDEMLGTIAERLGFGAQFDLVVGTPPR